MTEQNSTTAEALATDAHHRAVMLQGLIRGADLLHEDGSEEAAETLTSMLDAMKRDAAELAASLDRLEGKIRG